MKRRINHTLLTTVKEQTTNRKIFQKLNKVREAGEPFDKLLLHMISPKKKKKKGKEIVENIVRTGTGKGRTYTK